MQYIQDYFYLFTLLVRHVIIKLSVFTFIFIVVVLGTGRRCIVWPTWSVLLWPQIVHFLMAQSNHWVSVCPGVLCWHHIWAVEKIETILAILIIVNKFWSILGVDFKHAFLFMLNIYLKYLKNVLNNLFHIAPTRMLMPH